MLTRRCFGRSIALLLIATLAGCQSLGVTGLVRSTVTTELTPAVADAIASDMAGHLADQLGAGDTTIALKLDDTVFGAAIETSLRKRGFAIVTDQKDVGAATIPLAYVVDAFEGSVLVRMSTPTVELTCMYQATETSAEPVSPLSVMTRMPDGTA